MPIGEVIREHRKRKNLTQEEIANRLGVSTPAVNKWENGNSQPDIALLAPIARLLDVTLDQLLSFERELTPEEINGLVRELEAKCKQEPYADAFAWAKRIMARYPSCHRLIWQLTLILDVHRLTGDVPDDGQYDAEILAYYERALESGEEDVRTHAADALFSLYSRRKEYDKAEGYLDYFSAQNPERKRKQAELFSQTGRMEESLKAYEELLFSGHSMLSMVFASLYVLAMQEKDHERARYLIGKQRALAKLFETGEYHEASCGLELATLEKDEDATIGIMERMIHSLGSICGFIASPLYAHMTFKKIDEEFYTTLRADLLSHFKDAETYGYMQGNARWQELTREAE